MKRWLGICFDVLGFLWPAFVLALLLFQSHSEAQLAGDSCAAKIGSCDYYQCREQQHQCGDQGYYLGFGFKYCSASFGPSFQKASAQGQAWLTNTATCLQKEMQKNFPEQMACTEVQEKALKSHTACYLQSGICQLPFSDKLVILGIIHDELLNPSVFEEFWQVLTACAAGPL